MSKILEKIKNLFTDKGQMIAAAKQALVLVAILIITVGGGAVCGIINANDFGDSSAWYVALKKPSWNPPSALFGPMWTFLYVCMSFAAWLVWRRGGFQKQAVPLAFYFIQLAFNFAWVFIFGMAHALLVAFIWILFMWVLILITLILFYRSHKLAGYLLIPYQLWVTLSFALMGTVWWKNSADYEAGLGKIEL